MKEKDMWLRNTETWSKCERNIRRQQGGERRRKTGEELWMEGEHGEKERKGVWFERCGAVGG